MEENKLPQRKAMRAKYFDYSSTGAYFLTICTKDKKHILSRIVGTGVLDRPQKGVLDRPGNGVLDRPQTELLQGGKIAEKYIKQLDGFYGNVTVNEYVIMPNHIHLIVSIERDGPSGTPVPTLLNSTVSKFVSTLKRFVNKEVGENIFQRSFYDRIVRNNDEYMEICNYIRLNPDNWENDELYN